MRLTAFTGGLHSTSLATKAVPYTLGQYRAAGQYANFGEQDLMACDCVTGCEASAQSQHNGGGRGGPQAPSI